MRVGMIGLDTSHVIEFTNIVHGSNAPDELAGIEIVAGFPGGTDLPISRDRVSDFTAQLAATGVEIVEDIPTLLARVDAVMLTSVDGSVHLSQAIPVLESGKPLFIDKPLASNVADAIEIQRFARTRRVPCFTSSCIRFSPTLNREALEGEYGEVMGAATWGPCHLQEGVPDLFFYGIHGIEGLFTLMGPGCESVQRTHREGVDLLVGTWRDGRVGSYRGIRQGEAAFGATIFGSKEIAHLEIGVPYRELCVEIARFFRTSQPPVSLDESIEILAFMEASEASSRQGGAAVQVEGHTT